MKDEVKPNPNWVDAPYEAHVWTPEKGLHVETQQPIPRDGEYYNVDGEYRFTIKDGKVMKRTL